MRKIGLVLIFLLLVLVFFVKGREGPSSLPLSERGFLMGLVPNPANSPNSSFEDLVKAYEETGKIAEIGMVWVEKQGIGEFEVLKRNRVTTALRVYGLKLFLTLNFATVRVGAGGLRYEVEAPVGLTPSLSAPEFREAWMEEAKRIAEEFKPEYFSLGNEVNDYFCFHPEDQEPYFTLLEETYVTVKRVSPNTKVLVVLSYDRLLQNQQWGLLQELSKRVDVVGFTTYPYRIFASPDAIPQDYYSRVGQYLDKPIAFTEIGWSSSENSENVQASFLLRFLELTKDMNLEMVNWLFLHETVIENTLGHLSDPEIGTVALKKADGREKEVYRVWTKLKRLKVRK